MPRQIVFAPCSTLHDVWTKPCAMSCHRSLNHASFSNRRPRMPGKLRTRHLLSMDDLSPSEVGLVLSEAARMKAAHKAGKGEPLLAGKVLAMIFQKPSTPPHRPPPPA